MCIALIAAQVRELSQMATRLGYYFFDEDRRNPLGLEEVAFALVRNHATKGGVPVGSQSPTVRVRQSPDILGPSGATLPKEITTLSAGDYSGTLFFFFVFQVDGD